MRKEKNDMVEFGCDVKKELEEIAFELKNAYNALMYAEKEKNKLPKRVFEYPEDECVRVWDVGSEIIALRKQKVKELITILSYVIMGNADLGSDEKNDVELGTIYSLDDAFYKSKIVLFNNIINLCKRNATMEFEKTYGIPEDNDDE